MTLPLSPEELKAYNNVPTTPTSQKLGDTINALVGGGGAAGQKINFALTPTLAGGTGVFTTDITIPADPDRAGKCVLIIYSSSLTASLTGSVTGTVVGDNLTTGTTLATFNFETFGINYTWVNSLTANLGAGLGPGTYDAGGTPVTGNSGVPYVESISSTTETRQAVGSGANTWVYVDTAPSVAASTYRITVSGFPNIADCTFNPGFLIALHPFEIGV